MLRSLFWSGFGSRLSKAFGFGHKPQKLKCKMSTSLCANSQPKNSQLLFLAKHYIAIQKKILSCTGCFVWIWCKHLFMLQILIRCTVSTLYKLSLQNVDLKLSFLISTEGTRSTVEAVVLYQIFAFVKWQMRVVEFENFKANFLRAFFHISSQLVLNLSFF